MSNPVIPSTFLLTLLLAVGLFFFIKASVKDRTEEVKLTSLEGEESLSSQLKQYFAQRAYRVAHIDSTGNVVTFEGVVSPSLFLAIFLSGLSAVGFLCLGLVLAMLFPSVGSWFFGLLLFSPLTGIFYWQKSGRPEQVSLKLETITSPSNLTQSIVTVRGHRDELATLQSTLNLKPHD
ncbi:MAG: hypothetical protein RLZZ338_3918 [Cyanobacteriota bacterium]|jgi:hypothetical protein